MKKCCICEKPKKDKELNETIFDTFVCNECTIKDKEDRRNLLARNQPCPPPIEGAFKKSFEDIFVLGIKG